MMSWSACLPHSATDQLGPPLSARPTASYTISWDSIHSFIVRFGLGFKGGEPQSQFALDTLA